MDFSSEPIRPDRRITEEQALDLFKTADLLTLGTLADRKRRTMHPESIVTYVVDRNINYTNVCASECKFCAFFRREGHPQAYVISKDELKEKIKETKALGGTQILLQGGMNPRLDLDYYLDLLRFIKRNFSIHIHGFSPPEIFYMADKSSLSLSNTLKKLIDAGLDSIPGGGAEILVDEVRSVVSPNKCSSAQWLEVMKTAHHLGLKTTATMMSGHMETPAHIVEHLIKIRNLQDVTGGFTAFIPWTFQPKNTGINVTVASPVAYLKVLALSRIVLDNIENIQASWVTQGEKIAQIALMFGANDLGSTMIEENVVAAAGVSFRLNQQDLVRLIQGAGFRPAQRDCFYHLLEKDLFHERQRATD